MEILNWAREELHIATAETVTVAAEKVSEDILDDESNPYEQLASISPDADIPLDLFPEEASSSESQASAAIGDDGSIKVTLNEDMARLAPEFLKKRSGDIPKLKQGIADSKFDNIRVIGKSMKGTGGVYGFGQISEIGKNLETAAGEENLDLIGDLVLRLEDFLERVEVVIG